jgi:thioesterase domain-containing protein
MFENIIEEKLIKIWKALLGSIEISYCSSFLCLGGTDELFAVLIDMVSKEFLVDLNNVNVNDFVYFCQQINLIRLNSSKVEDDILVKIKSGGSSKVLVVIHPIGGTLFSYANLLYDIKADVTIWGIQDPSIVGVLQNYHSLEEQALFYIRVLEKKVDINNLIFLGHSYGATLAFEMARQINDKGIYVRHLIMLDGWAKIPFARNFKKSFRKIILRQVDKLKLQRFISSVGIESKWLDMLWRRACLLMLYKPIAVPVSCTLFAAKEILPEYKVEYDSYSRWGDYVNELKIFLVPGNHETMLEKKNVVHMICKITKILEEVNE